MLIHLALGALGGLAFVALARALGPGREVWLYALGLGAAALVYVGFALAAGPDAWLAVEMVGVVLFGVLAVFGLRVAPVLIAAGWLLHVGWDVALHRMIEASFVPAGYPELCLGFDLVVAAAIALRVRTGALAPAPFEAPPS